MEDDSFRRLLLQYGHFQRRNNCCFGSKALAEGIADDLPIEEFHDHREILPAAIGPEIRDVACPGFERHFRGEVLLQDIRCNGFLVIRVRRNLELSGGLGPEPHRSHQSGHARPTALHASLLQFIGDARAAIDLIVLVMDRFNGVLEFLSLLAARAFRRCVHP